MPVRLRRKETYNSKNGFVVSLVKPPDVGMNESEIQISNLYMISGSVKPTGLPIDPTSRLLL
jgi:hypothetical protein